MMRLRAVAGTMVMVVLAIAAPAAQSDSAELLGRADVLLLTDNFAEARPLYEQALKNAPEDLRDYSNVTDVIQAAMQDAVGSPSGTGTGTGPGGDPTGPASSDKPRTPAGVPPASYYRRGIDSLGTTQADSLPIPLLVLAGLGSLLLLTAGGLAANKRIRALRAARGEPPATRL